METVRQQVIVVAGGDPVGPPAVVGVDPTEAIVIAADSGLDNAVALGWAAHVDVVVGDFDSVSATALEAAELRGADVRRHPTDKDSVDLELALGVAVELTAADTSVDEPATPPDVLVLGAVGGRIDHALANMLLLASPRFTDLRIRWAADDARGWIVRERLVVPVERDSTVTTLAFHGTATVSLDGFVWPLERRDIAPGSSLGVSNLAEIDRPTVTVHQGVVVVIAPFVPDAASPSNQGGT